MKKIMAIVIVSATSFAATPSCFADSATTKEGGYVFGALGFNPAKWSDTSVIAGDGSEVQVRDGKAAGSIWEMGAGYRINTNLALELSYADFGETKSNLVSDGTNVGQFTGSWRAERLGVLGILPINDQVEMFGKVTLNNMHFKVTSEDTVKSNSTKAGIGLGLNWNLTRNTALRAEYEYLPTEIKYTTDSGDVLKTNKLNLLKIGVAYSF